jgi:hypothetical protein
MFGIIFLPLLDVRRGRVALEARRVLLSGMMIASNLHPTMPAAICGL